MGLGSGGNRGYCRRGVGDVAGHGDATDLGGNGLRQFGIEIAHRDLRAILGEPSRGCRTQSRRAAGDDRSLIL